MTHPFHAAKSIGAELKKILQSEQTLISKTKELEIATQQKIATSKKLEQEMREVPVLEENVKSLKLQINILKRQLQNRNEELELFQEIAPSVKEEKVQVLDRLVKEKNKQVKSLKDELDMKEAELETSN